jgi:GGDEF domain-containing protein
MIEQLSGNKSTNNPTGFEMSHLKIDSRAVRNALQQVVENKLENCNGCKLDQAILDACIENVFFLGKLKELNHIVTGGRGDIENAFDQYASIIEKQLLQQDDNGNKMERPISMEKIDGTMGRYIDKLKKILFKVDSFQEVEEGTKFNTSVKEEKRKIVDEYMSKFTGARFLEEMNRQYNERLQISAHAHFMTVMTRKVSDKLESFKSKNEKIDESNSKKLRSIATLFFDLDGLKMLNDMSLGGYESGDKALWVMARALTNSKLKEWTEGLDIELVPAHRSGDEFLLGIVAEDSVDLADDSLTFQGVDGETVERTSLVKYIGDYIKKTVQNFGQEDKSSINSDKDESTEPQNNKDNQDKKNQVKTPPSMRDIIDFSNKEQRDKFEEETRKMPGELQKLFNEDFQYQLSCSYGYATLEDGFKRNVEDKLDFGDKDLTYETIVYKLTGRGLVDSASDKMKIDKKDGRLKRVGSSRLEDRLLEILYRTGREQRDWYIDKADFIEIEKVLFEFRDEVLELREKIKKAEVKLKIERRRKKGGENVIKHNAQMSAQIVSEKNKTIINLEEQLASLRDQNNKLAGQLNGIEE